MKLALLTHHWVPNFGANLQALATYSFLKNAGHDITVLNYIPEGLENRYREICTAEQFNQHVEFCSTNFLQSPLLRSEQDLIDHCAESQYQVVVCGSDAILRLNKSGSSHEGAFPNPYWLNWVKTSDKLAETKRAFISASCTGSNYLVFPKKMKRDIADTLAGVDFISVRDNWTRMMLSHVTGGEINPLVTADPVSIFNHAVTLDAKWEEPAKRAGKYILFSMHPKRISDGWVKKFVDVCHERGYQVIGLPFPEMEMPFSALDGNVALPVSPLEWYSWIKHAAGFVGERFHPTICSLFNGVPTVSVDHYRKRGIQGKFMWFNIPMTSKVYSVCKQAGVGKNCVHFPKLEHMSGEAVLSKMEQWDKEKALAYTGPASELFKESLNNIAAL